jgi:serine/threonine protein kinase
MVSETPQPHAAKSHSRLILLGAPECHPGPSKQIHVPRSIDIWSLGCVFSVAASWVVLGAQGIKQFTCVRQRAISKAHDSNSCTKLGEPKGDHFHDGTEVLQDVIYWHNHLRKACRGTDTITSQMLDLVDRKMLRGNAKERIEASKLCEEMGQILSKSHEATQDSLPESLKEALIQMDEDALSQSSQSKPHPTPASDLLGPNTFQDRKTRKFKLLDVPAMATSHRSEALKPELASLAQSARHPVASPTDINEKIPVSTNLSTPQTSGYSGGGNVDQSSRRPDQQLSHLRDQHSPDEKSTLQKIGTSGSFIASQTAASQYGIQNVWQARLDIERRRRDSLFGRTGKDKLLTQHFGDRDIVSCLPWCG